jgi:hypothetical protein
LKKIIKQYLSQTAILLKAFEYFFVVVRLYFWKFVFAREEVARGGLAIGAMQQMPRDPFQSPIQSLKKRGLFEIKRDILYGTPQRPFDPSPPQRPFDPSPPLRSSQVSNAQKKFIN